MRYGEIGSGLELADLEKKKEKRNEKGKKRKGYEKAHWKKQMKYLRKQKKQSWKGIMHGSNSLRVAATIA